MTSSTLHLCFACNHHFPLVNLQSYTIHKDIHNVLTEMRSRIVSLKRSASSYQKSSLVDLEGDCRSLLQILGENQMDTMEKARRVLAESPSPQYAETSVPKGAATQAQKPTMKKSSTAAGRRLTSARRSCVRMETDGGESGHPEQSSNLFNSPQNVDQRIPSNCPQNETTVPPLRLGEMSTNLRPLGLSKRNEHIPSGSSSSRAMSATGRWPFLRQALLNSVSHTKVHQGLQHTRPGTARSMFPPQESIVDFSRFMHRRRIDTVGSAFYILLRTIKEKTRANCARIWFVLSSTGEHLVAPIEVGNVATTSAASYNRLNGATSPVITTISSGIVGGVISSGIALNMASGDHETLNMLLMPIGRRKNDGKGLFGVIQIMDKVGSEVFSKIDEHLTLTAADLCEHICNTYSDILAELCTKMYEPPPLTEQDAANIPSNRMKAPIHTHLEGASSARTKLSKYQELDDFQVASQLIFRPYLQGIDVTFPPDADTIEICSSLKDAAQHIQNLEATWRTSLATIQDLRTREHTMSLALEQSMLQVTKLQQQCSSPTEPRNSTRAAAHVRFDDSELK